MGKIYPIVRVLAVLVAIAAAFVTVPQATAILLVLGAISGIGNTNEDNMRVFVITIVIAVAAKQLDAIPTVGTYLTTIFTGLGAATFGASASGIAMGLYRRTVGELMAKPAA